MIFRYPDKPNEAFLQMLPKLDTGEYLIQSKADGYNAVIEGIDNKITIKSRHNKLLPVSNHIIEQITSLKLPQPFMLNGEWLERRAGDTEAIQFFDVMYLNDVWQGQVDYIERWNWLTNNIIQTKNVGLVRTAYTGFVKFMEQCIDDPTSEGVVIKHRKFKLIGDLKTSRNNPLCIKIKFRAGPSGQTILITKQQLAMV